MKLRVGTYAIELNLFSCLTKSTPKFDTVMFNLLYSLLTIQYISSINTQYFNGERGVVRRASSPGLMTVTRVAIS